MDFEKLNELLKRYWECQTNLEEEEQLRQYFGKGNIPEELKTTAALFRYFEQEKHKTVHAEFEKPVIQNKKTANRTRKGVSHTLITYSLRIAAGVAVLLAAIFLVRQELRKPDAMAISGELVDTYDNPKEAFEETKRALEMISKGFGRAEQQAKKINAFNDAQEKIQSQLKKDSEL